MDNLLGTTALTKPELPLYIDSTMMSCFRSCPIKFYREFVLGLRPSAISVDLHAGGCFATALEVFYEAMYIGGKTFDQALALAYKRYLAEWGDFVPWKDTPKTRENVWAAIEDYLETYPPLTDKVQPYMLAGKPSMEFTFAEPLEYGENGEPFPMHPNGDPFVYSGRFDMLGMLNNSIPCVRDEKTTTSIGATWASQWDLRSQFSGYVWACQQNGIQLDTVVVRGIGILKTKFHQVEAIKQFSKHNVDRWFEQLRRDMWRLRRSWDEGYWDFNLAESCSAYGGCAFRDLCNSPNEERWYSNYTVRKWNPLQKNPIKTEGVAA
jgi:hypothetical protein